MEYLFYLLLFLFGLATGSFLNVVSLRYDPSKNLFNIANLSGRSRCPYCKKELQWFELIPLLSFIFQLGRCCKCHHRLTFQYPIVELLSGLIFLIVPLYLNSHYGVSSGNFTELLAPHWYYGLILLWISAFLAWLLISLIDLKHYLIPDELNVFLGVLGVILVLILLSQKSFFPPFQDSFLEHYNLVFSPFTSPILNHLLGGVAGFLFFGGIVFLSSGRAMGMGDAKLALASGLLLGWADIGLAMALSFIFGGIIGAAFLLMKTKEMRDRLPFAPFFVFGILATFFCGFDIVKWYFSLFSL